jgi:hypothetical protein
MTAKKKTAMFKIAPTGVSKLTTGLTGKSTGNKVAGLPAPTGQNFVDPVKTTPGPAATIANTTPFPVDPAYDQQAAALKNSFNGSLADLDAQRTQTLLDYGYTGKFDDKGSLVADSLAFDPNNPFSKAALLQRHYQNAQRGNSTSYAARGQLYAGSLQNAIKETDHQRDLSDDSLKKSLNATLVNNLIQRRTAGTNLELGLAQAGADRLTRAPNNPLYSPAIDTAPAATTTTSTPATDKGVIVRPSKANGGKLWRYRKSTTGKLIPLGPA